MAESAFGFVVEKMRIGEASPSGTEARPSGSLRLWHSYRAGQTRAPATSADYANMVWAAIRLYEATAKPDYLATARALAATLDKHYWLPEAGGYATSADDTTDVIVRLRSAHDDAVPNANGTMIGALMHLYLLTGDEQYRTRASQIPDAFAGEVGANALGHCGLLAGGFDLLSPSQVAIVGAGEATSQLEAALHGVALPGALEQVLADTSGLPTSSLLGGKTASPGKASAYVCSGTSCAPPAESSEALISLLKLSRRA